MKYKVKVTVIDKNIPLQQFLTGSKIQNVTDYLEQEVLGELLDEYGAFISKPGIGLVNALRKIYARTDKKL